MGDISKKQMVKTILSRLLVFSALIFYFEAKSDSITYVEFDNSIVENRKVYNGSFQTPYILFRIDKINPIQSEPKGPASVEVTSQEFEQIQQGLAKQLGQTYIPGSLKKLKLSSGLSITIGEYAFVDGKSQVYFGESQEKTSNYLLRSFQMAEATDLSQGWRGPLWNLMISMLNDRVLAKRFGIVTERGHSKKEWGEFFNYLKIKGYIRFLPNLSNIHNLSRPEYLLFGNSTSKRKANLISHLALQGLGRSILEDSDYKIDRNGVGVEQAHTLLFSDNNPETLEVVLQALEKITTGRYTQRNIKYVIVNTGLDSDVRKSNRPRVFVLTKDDGRARALTTEEKETELSLVSAAFSTKKESQKFSCQGLFL